jgi:hypothetical protein
MGETDDGPGPAGLPPEPLANGSGAAAILAAGVGSLALGAFALTGDASPIVKHAFDIWNPTGPLSGVTTLAIMVWLAVWALLNQRWRRREVDLAWVGVGAFIALAAGFALTFPPFADWLRGR